MRRTFLGAMAAMAVPTVADASWQSSILDLINHERALADEREWLIHGELQAPREPMSYSSLLAESGQWWARALTSTGLVDHTGYLNADGFLLNPATGRVASRVWLPTYQPDRFTYWGYRNKYLGLEDYLLSSEVGVFLKRATPENVVSAWVNSGYAHDPRQARKHYGVIINPLWSQFGVGSARWGSGKESVFGEVAA